MNRRCFGALAAASAAALAGCGGSSNSGLSAGAFSKAADKLCTTTNAQIRALGQLSPKGTQADVAKLDQADAVITVVIKKFNALHGPSALNAARDRFVTDLNNLKLDLSSASSLAKSGDKPGYVSSLTSASGSGLAATASADGAKLGAKACATTT